MYGPQRIPLIEAQLTDYSQLHQQRQTRWQRALNTIEELFEAAGHGNVRAFRALEDIQAGRRRLWETQTTSDFAALTSELMGRQLKARFMQQPSVFRRYVPIRATPITNFKNVYAVAVDRSNQSVTFNSAIPENTAFGYSAFADSSEGYKVAKYIEGYKHSFELKMNDDLGGLAQVVPYMVEDQVYVQEYFAVTLHCDANGPHATLYTAGRGNIVNDGATNNMPMSEAALETAFNQIGQATDASGRPILLNNGLIVVVGNKALERKALRFKNMIETRRTEGSTVVVTTNSLSDFDVVYNPFIGQIVTTNLATSWWVFPRPTPNPTRTWAEMGFLQGFDVPQVYMKRPNILTLGGAEVAGIGDFNTWSMEYAVATAFGGRQLADYQVTVASNGTGT